MEHERPWATMPMIQEPYDPFDPRHGAFMGDEWDDSSTYEGSLAGLSSWGFNIQSA